MHVDGFRFDLASTLARELHEVDRLSAFFDLIQQDPVISRVKLIAEPWDVGEGGYQVGNFPPLWSEWNGKYRDTVRDYWRGEEQPPGRVRLPLHRQLRPLPETTGGGPYASINFVTAHDGFTLHDLVSYNDKHNEANGEDNRDGESHNRSWNCGAEGPTDDPAGASRCAPRQQRNFLATLLLSQGVPMLLARRRARPHAARQQQRLLPGQRDLLGRLGERATTTCSRSPRRLIELRRAHPVFRRRAGSRAGRSTAAASPTSPGSRPTAAPWRTSDWDQAFAQSLGVFLNGAVACARTAAGERRVDDSFYVLFNAHHEPLTFTLPERAVGKARGRPVVDTARPPAPRARRPRRRDRSRSRAVRPSS